MRSTVRKFFVAIMLMALVGFVFVQTFASSVNAETYEAKVTVKGDTTGYDTVAEAVAAINEADAEAVLEVQGDVILDAGMVFTNPNKITITGEGYTIKRGAFTGSMVKGKKILLKDIVLDGNSGSGGGADVSGAGVSISEEGNLELDNAAIVNNKIISGDKDGGAVYAPNAKVTLKNGSTIRNNTATRSAGAIYGGDVYIEDSKIEDNTAGEGNKEKDAVRGGAIFAENLTITTTNDEKTKEEDKKYTVIKGNVAKGGRGGAIYLDGEGERDIENGTVIKEKQKGELVMDGDTIITDNSTEADDAGSITSGGAVFIKNGKATIKGNTQIYKNEAKGEKGFGGAMAIGKDAKGDLTLEGNALIAENTAEAKGGGIRIHEGDSKVFVKDSVQITDNSAPLGKNIYIEESATKYKRLTMSGNLNEDAIIGVRTAKDIPEEGAVFGKTDTSFTGAGAIISDKDARFRAKKDDNGNLLWYNSELTVKKDKESDKKGADEKQPEETTVSGPAQEEESGDETDPEPAGEKKDDKKEDKKEDKKSGPCITYLDAETGVQKSLDIKKGEKVNIIAAAGKYNGVGGNSVIFVKEDKKVADAKAPEGMVFAGWKVGEEEGYAHTLTAVYNVRLVVYGKDSTLEGGAGDVIGTLGDARLLSFDTKQEAEDAAGDLREKGFLVSEDISLTADEDTSIRSTSTDSTDKSAADNPFIQAQEIIEEGAETPENAGNMRIALIDTGVDNEEVERYSVIGDDLSDASGHGTKMLDFIRQEEPDAEVISIKALDKEGRGTIAGIYAAVELALSKDVKLINLSLSARSTEENEILKTIIERAKAQGVTVIVSAGNAGRDAADYTPASIKDAITIGAIDSNKRKISTSNYGDAVDYWVQADSTSEATARFTGMCALHASVKEAVKAAKGERIFTTDQITVDIDGSENKEDNTDGDFRANVSTADTLPWLTISADGTTIEKFNYVAESSPTEITIPATDPATGNTITSIADRAFEGCGLTKVDFESGCAITTIGEFAFSGNEFTSIKLPGTVSSLGKYCFLSCTLMQKIDFSACSDLKILPHGCCEVSNSLNEVLFPPNLEEINDRALYSNSAREFTLKIPASVKTIYSISGCFGRLTTLDLTNFEPGAFPSISVRNNPSSRTNVIWGNKNSNMSDTSTCLLINTRTGLICGLKQNPSSFRDWNSGNITIPATVSGTTVKGFSTGAFFNLNGFAKGLNGITFANGVNINEIPESCFNWSSLQKISNIPSTVKKIGKAAFDFSNLKDSEVVLPGVTYIGDYAFQGVNTNLTVTLQSDAVSYIGKDAFVPYGSDSKGITQVNLRNMIKDSVDGAPWGAYYATVNWKDQSTPPVVKTDLTGLWEFNSDTGTIFKYLGTTDVNNLTVPNKLTYQGQSYDITTVGRGGSRVATVKVNNLIVSEGIIHIHEAAFNHTGIKTVTFPDTLQVIDYDAFGYNSLTKVSFPKSLEQIGMHTFRNNKIAGVVEIPGNVKSISSEAFNDNTGITKIYVDQYKRALGDEYDPDNGKYIHSPILVQGNAPFGAPAGTPVFYRDDEFPNITYSFDTNPDDNTVTLNVEVLSVNDAYFIKDIRDKDGRSIVTGTLPTTSPTTNPARGQYTITNIQGNGDYLFTVYYGLPTDTAESSWKSASYSETVDDFHDVIYDLNGGTYDNAATYTDSDGPYVTGYEKHTALEPDGSKLLSGAANKYFGGWNTKADGSGTTYGGNESLGTMPNKDVTLYAVWTGTPMSVDDEKMDVHITKTWEDNGNADSIRPEKITIRLKNITTDEVVGTGEMTGDATADTWTYTFAGVPVYVPGTNGGTSYEYEILEDSITGYRLLTSDYTQGSRRTYTYVADNSAEDLLNLSGVVVPAGSNQDTLKDYLPSANVSVPNLYSTYMGSSACEEYIFDNLGNTDFQMYELGSTYYSPIRVGAQIVLAPGATKSWSGDQYSIRFPGVVSTVNGTADLVLTYGNITVTNKSNKTVTRVYPTSGGGVSSYCEFEGASATETVDPGAGVSVDVRYEVIDSVTGTPVDGIMNLGFYDLDWQDHTTSDVSLQGGPQSPFCESVTVIEGAVAPAYLPETSWLLDTADETDTHNPNGYECVYRAMGTPDGTCNGIRFMSPGQYGSGTTFNSGVGFTVQSYGTVLRYTGSSTRAASLSAAAITARTYDFAKDTATLTNELLPSYAQTEDTMSVEFTKTWDDNNNAAGARPETITVTLSQTNPTTGTTVEVYSTAQVTGSPTADTWTHTFVGVPVYTDANRTTEYIYAIKETSVDNYTASNDGNATYTTGPRRTYTYVEDNGANDASNITGIVMPQGSTEGIADAESFLKNVPGGKVELLQDKLNVSEAEFVATGDGGHFAVEGNVVAWNANGSPVPAKSDTYLAGSFTLLFKDAAMTEQGLKDVKYTYSNVRIKTNEYSVEKIQLSRGHSAIFYAVPSIGIPTSFPAGAKYWIGASEDITLEVLNEDGSKYESTMLLGYRDLDGADYSGATGNSTAILGAASPFSETIEVLSGAVSPAYVPETNHLVNESLYVNGVSGVAGTATDGLANGLRIGGVPDDQSTFKAGFAVLCNTSGFTVRYSGSPTLYQTNATALSGMGASISYSVPAVRDTATLTNQYIPSYAQTEETMSVEFTKTWDDNNNAAGARPETITVTLKQDGQEYRTAQVTGNPTADTWTYTFTDVPVYKDATNTDEHVYTITETVPDNYTASDNGNAAYTTGARRSYTYVADNGAEDALDMPGVVVPRGSDESTISGYTPFATVAFEPSRMTIASAGQDGYVFEDLSGGLFSVREINKSNGRTYTGVMFLENVPAGQTRTLDGQQFRIRFTDAAYTQEGTADVVITYSNIAIYNSATVGACNVLLTDGIWAMALWDAVDGSFYSNNHFGLGVAFDSSFKVVESGTDTPIEGTYLLSVRDLDANDYTNGTSGPYEGGNAPYAESITLLSGALSPAFVPQTSRMLESSQSGVQIYNGGITVVGQPDNQGYANGLRFVNTLTQEGDSDTYNSGFLALVDAAGYTMRWTGSGPNTSSGISTNTAHNVTFSKDTATLTNKVLPEYARQEEEMTVQFTKTWNDNNDAEGLRPNSIQITLNRDGEPFRTVEVTGAHDADTWEYSFVGVPIYKADGTEYTYTVTEGDVLYYTASNGGTAEYTMGQRRVYTYIEDNGAEDQSSISGVVKRGTNSRDCTDPNSVLAGVPLYSFDMPQGIVSFRYLESAGRSYTYTVEGEGDGGHFKLEKDDNGREVVFYKNANLAPSATPHQIPGKLIVTFPQIVYTSDGNAYNLRVIYDNIEVYNDPSKANAKAIKDFSVTPGAGVWFSFRTNTTGTDVNNSGTVAAIGVDVELQIVDDTGTVVDGTFPFFIEGISNTSYTNRAGYDPRVLIKSGAVTPAYITSTSNLTVDTSNQVGQTANGLLFTSNTPTGGSWTFDNGFSVIMKSDAATQTGGKVRLTNSSLGHSAGREFLFNYISSNDTATLTNTVKPVVPSGLGIGQDKVISMLIPIITIACGGMGAFIFFEIRRRRRRRPDQGQEPV